MIKLKGKSKRCLVCKKEFYVYPYLLKRGFGQYCSFKCYLEKRGKEIICQCLVCKKDFLTHSCFIKKGFGKFCSMKCYGKDKKNNKVPMPLRLGSIGWNKGRHFLEFSGKNSPAWRGGITPINEALRKTFEYKEWRQQIFKRDGYKCIVGGTKHGNKLNADHIKSFSSFPDLRFDITNGRTLCVDCHRKTDNYGSRAIHL